MAKRPRKPEPEQPEPAPQYDGTPGTMPRGDEGWPEWLEALRLRLARQVDPEAKRPLPQATVARLVGSAQSLWAHWESGRRVPDEPRRILLWLLAGGDFHAAPR